MKINKSKMLEDTETALRNKFEKANSNSLPYLEKSILNLRTHGINQTENLLMTAGTSNHPAQRDAIWALGILGIGKSVPLLLNLLGDENMSEEIRREAGVRLASLVRNRTMNRLLKILDKSDELAREMICYVLGYLDDKRAVQPLVKRLEDKTEATRVRAQAAESLAYHSDPETLMLLIECLNDDTPEVRFWAAFALGYLQDKEALPHLETLVKKDQSYIANYGAVSKEALNSINKIIGIVE